MIPEAQRKDRNGQKYCNQIRQMALQGRAWRDAHLQTNAKVQFNWPREMMLAASPQCALETHFITVDAPGREWLDAIMKGLEEEVTAFQVRCAFNLMDNKNLT